jgi:hypothetical protein
VVNKKSKFVQKTFNRIAASKQVFAVKLSGG